MSKQFLLSLVFATLVGVGLSSPISAHAQTLHTSPDLMVVTATKGLNIRNSACGVVTTVKSGNILKKSSTPSTIQCKVNGTTHTLTKVEEFSTSSSIPTDSYAALAFTSKIYDFNPEFAKRPINTSVTPTVTATAGLNLRDGNCNRISTVPFQYKFDRQAFPAEGGGFTLCKVRNEYHFMHPVTIQGKTYFVASTYLNMVV